MFSTNILPNLEAISHFDDKKTLVASYHYLDVIAHEHAIAFTVAKMMDQDILAETRQAVLDALENGTDFRTFQKRLKPYLMAKGWWGEQVLVDPKDGKGKKVQLGSTRRLRTIYQTNKHTAYAAGQWQRIQANKNTFPYLHYKPSVAGKPRKEHKRYYNLVLPVDHAIWQYIMPPNGFGCLCSVKQLTKKQAEAIGISEDFEIEWEEVENPRTGKTIIIPKDIDMSFAHNHSKRIDNLFDMAQQKHGKSFVDGIKQGLISLFTKKAESTVSDLPPPSEWQKAALIGKQLMEKHQDLFDIDITQPHAFANAVQTMLQRENIATGAIVNAQGDHVKNLQSILKRYPASWIEKANEMGDVYVRNLKGRGYQAYIETDNMANALNKHIEKHPKLKVFKKYKQQFKQGDSLLYVNKLEKLNGHADDVVIHEMGHRLQKAMPTLDEYFTQLWLSRTKTETTRPLRNIQKERGEYPSYHASEVGRKDNFVHVYIGRDYGTLEKPNPAEVLTVVYQAILGENTGTISIEKFLQDDPEMIHLAIALLARYQP